MSETHLIETAWRHFSTSEHSELLACGLAADGATLFASHKSLARG